jgi:hypothetical protein
MSGKRNGAHPQITAQVETVTPELALEWLQNAARNRPIADPTVRRYGADMRTGRWQLTGQSIIFSIEGKLLDGRHRLTAVVATRCAIETVVVRGVEAEAFEMIDAGRTRTLANTLAIDGHKNTTATSASARMVWAYAAGTSLKYGTSRAELLALIRDHPYISEVVDMVIRRDALTKPMGVPRSALIATLVLANEGRKYDDQVRSFLEGFVTGEGLFGGDPRLTLRRWLTRMRQETGNLGARVAEPFFAATVRAWSAFLMNRDLTTIRLPMFFNRETLPLEGFDLALWGDVPDLSASSFSALGAAHFEPQEGPSPG